MRTVTHLSESEIKAAIAAFAGAAANNVVLRVQTGQRDEQIVTAEIAVETPAPVRPNATAENCQRELMAAGKPYPRTCAACGLAGPCRKGLTA